MPKLDYEQITADDQSLFAIGNLLISRYIQIAENHSKQKRPADTHKPMEQLELLISAFLDQSSKWSVTLLNFYETPTHSYIIEFNGSAQTGTQIAEAVSAFFGCDPTPYSCKRHLGAATDCLQLTPKSKSRKPVPKQFSELGLTKRKP